VVAVEGDAERLPLESGSFDAVVCECAFCTFPDKATAAAEFRRVLRPGGRLGLSDLTRTGPLPPDLDGLLAWVACIADARPTAEYVAYLQGAQLLVSLKKLDLPAVDFGQAQALARSAAAAVTAGTLGYALVTGTRRTP